MNEIALFGKKIGMTREFYKTGQLVPVTVLKVEKARVIQVIDEEKQFALKWKIRKNNGQFLISIYGVNRLEFREKTRKENYAINKIKIKNRTKIFQQIDIMIVCISEINKRFK